MVSQSIHTYYTVKPPYNHICPAGVCQTKVTVGLSVIEHLAFVLFAT